MTHPLCCRIVAPQHLLTMAFAFVMSLLTQSDLAHAQDIEQAVIRVAKADVYCGPNSDYYSTMQLKRGDRVEIIEKGIDGWVSIVPPQQSFCWLAGRDCKLLSNGKEVEIVAATTVCWIGSTLKQTEYRWQSQLNRGDRIAIIGEAQRRDDNGSSQLWYRVAPPADELRWVRIEHLGTAEDIAQSAVVTASAEQPVNDRKSTRNEKSVLADNSGKPDRKISLATAYEPIAAPKPPRTLTPSMNAAEMNPMQPASQNFQPGPTAAGYFDQTYESPRNIATRPVPMPRQNPMGNRGMQPAPNWDQFQAFPTQNAAPNMAAAGNGNTRYASTPVGPVEWFFSDFLHRNDGGQGAMPMTPTPDPYTQQQPRPAMQPPYSERTYAPDQPFQSRIAQLPRPRRRSTNDSLNGFQSDSSMLAGQPESTWQDATLQSPTSLGNIANTMSQTATANYLGNQGAQYPTATTWHGINTPNNYVPSNNTVQTASSASTQPNLDQVYAPVNISSPELQQIQLALSSEVAKPIEQWNLANYKSTIEERLQQSNDPLYRGEARLLIDRIEAFVQLKNRSTHTIPASDTQPTYGPLVPSNPETPATWLNASQYDASGWLVPVHATHSGQPEYAITDDRGNTLAYVTAQPGVNLRRYLRQPVGLKGRRGYLADLAANHIVVERVVSLQR